MDELKIEYIPVSKLRPYDKNARKHDKKSVEVIANSIREFGFDDPIGIWGDNFIVEGHGLSQAMNYALDNGVDFSTMDAAQINAKLGTRFNANDVASMQYTDAYMVVAMHPIGRDVMLQRGAHDDVLRNVFGIQDYSRMSEAQLQAQLVGKGFQTTSYMSTSYDVTKNPFLSAASGSGVSGGREVVYNIKAGAQTRMLFGAKKQSEIVLDKGTKFRITGVRYTGNIAMPRGGASKKQIVIDIETV